MPSTRTWILLGMAVAGVGAAGYVMTRKTDWTQARRVPLAAKDIDMFGGPLEATWSQANLVDRDFGNMAHSQVDVNAVMTITLPMTLPVAKVTLYNRVDCCRERVQGMRVELLDEEKEVVVSRLIRLTDPAKKLEINVPLEADGRYIRMTPGDGNVINLAELEVWALLDALDAADTPATATATATATSSASATPAIPSDPSIITG